MAAMLCLKWLMLSAKVVASDSATAKEYLTVPPSTNKRQILPHAKKQLNDTCSLSKIY